MANWFYYDKNRQKKGPITPQQLQQLVRQGMITPDTFVETEQGKTAKAGQIKGLFAAPPQSSANSVSQGNAGVYGFKQEPPKPIPVPPPVQQQAPAPQSVYCTHCGQSVNPTAVACLSCGASPKGHKKFCGSCGAPLSEVQVICVKCGVAVNVPPPQQANIWKTITGQAATQPSPNYLQQPYQSSNAGELPVPISPTATIKKLNTCYFWYWMLAVVGIFFSFVAGGLVGLLSYDREYVPIVVGIICLPIGIVLLVFWCLLLYTLWTVIPKGIASTTPGKAVGFSFIPLFHLYWQFIAVYQLGNNMNKTLERQGMGYRVNTRFALTACIFYCMQALLALVPVPDQLSVMINLVIAALSVSASGSSIVNFGMLVTGATILLEQKLRNEPNIQY
ncbi:hypothetical protein FACS1894170_11120 [Planctomycetales bacterium]|nr:hypothetical protein FACS1894170_11120 [Planctomycetales bacterium]